MQNQFASIPLASDPLRGPLEQFVSEHTGRPWKVKEARDMAEFACHPAAILSDGSYSVFAKFSEVANGLEQFEVELSGLRLFSERSGVLIPTPIGIISVRGGGSIDDRLLRHILPNLPDLRGHPAEDKEKQARIRGKIVRISKK